MGFKAAASELGTEGGLRTRTDTDTVKAKSIRIRTYPYALETCLMYAEGKSLYAILNQLYVILQVITPPGKLSIISSTDNNPLSTCCETDTHSNALS